ncbi:MAG: iron ABC transporter permease [Gammaproteobacteria bacterium]|nr:iron ABC transporter permease [Gammaproteobacteria bacterium]
MKKFQASIILVILCLGSIALAISAGSTTLSANEIFSSLTNEQGLPHTLIFELRLPRAMLAFICGGMLALAGLLMQALLRNPLADPYILGVSGGAASGALLAILFGMGALVIQVSAFSGALLSIMLVFALAHSNSSWTSNRLLLTGVVLAAGWNAVISFLLTTSSSQQIYGMLFWLMGDLSYNQLSFWEAPLLAIITLVSFIFSRHLNLMSRGEMQAAALGVNTRTVRLVLFSTASLLTAVAISLAGSIGFIGLMAPHMLRLIIGSDHRLLVPAVVILGGTLLILADTLARTLLAPTQLPVGILTAVLGVPTFLYLLYRRS